MARQTLLPPGSTLKTFVLAALLQKGKLSPHAAFVCPQHLKIGYRTLDCSHPRIATPMGVSTALAYSCNCFVANAATRFGPGELAAELQRAGFGAGRIE